jgi:hypothetical protein
VQRRIAIAENGSTVDSCFDCVLFVSLFRLILLLPYVFRWLLRVVVGCCLFLVRWLFLLLCVFTSQLRSNESTRFKLPPTFKKHVQPEVAASWHVKALQTIYKKLCTTPGPKAFEKQKGFVP